MGYKKKPVKSTKSVQKTRKTATGGTEVYYVDEVVTTYESVWESDSYDSGSCGSSE
jgi:hypothetical protein